MGQNRPLWIAVDMWISCGQSAPGQEALENPASQERAFGDETREVSQRGGPGVEQGERLVGAVDAAGGDDLERVSEAGARAADVGERRRKELRAGQAAGPL